MTRPALFSLPSVLLAFVLAVIASAADSSARIELRRDDAKGRLEVLIDGKEAVVYCYGDSVDLPHYFPVRSPSGKTLTVQQTEPYPHHRSLWFADTVELEGHRRMSTYMALYSGAGKDRQPPYRERVRQVEFLPEKVEGNRAELGMKLVWEMDAGNTAVLDEVRRVRIAALGKGEYFADMTFTLTASYGDVKFVSDAAHYAWPYVRMSPEFSVDQGGRMVNSEGGVNQAKTHGKPAVWIDYSNTVGGATEGLAVFSHPENEHPHTWLTRDYGTFGPRRADARNGKPFLLKKGDSLRQRVAILVHSGDEKSGLVAHRYRQYTEGKL